VGRLTTSCPRLARSCSGAIAASLSCFNLFIANFPGTTLRAVATPDKGGNSLTSVCERPHGKTFFSSEDHEATPVMTGIAPQAYFEIFEENLGTSAVDGAQRENSFSLPHLMGEG